MALVFNAATQPGTEHYSISFSGSGFLMTYQLGVGQCLLEKAPWLLRGAHRVYGASAGALAAAAVVCGTDLEPVREDVVKVVKMVEEHALGALNPATDLFGQMEGVLRRRLAKNAHQLASGRLCISMTRVSDGKNVLVSEFQSNEELVKALMCSCFVPGYSGLIPPSYKGVHYVDGGFTNIRPVQDSGCTITVSPFAGDTDICPCDGTKDFYELVMNDYNIQFTAINSFRLANALLPRNWMAIEEAYYNGYQDTMFYLQSNDVTPHHPTWVAQLVPQNEEQKGPLVAENDEVEQDCAEHNPLESNQGPEDLSWSLNTFEQALQHNLPSKIQDDLLFYVVAYMGLMNFLSVYLPTKFLSSMLLAILLPVYIAVTVLHRFLNWLSYFLVIAFWIWQDTKCMMFFVVNTSVSSLKKNLLKRVNKRSVPFSQAEPQFYTIFFTLDLERENCKNQDRKASGHLTQ
ncbi:patatin-like phospholipase domain-containing protein 2 [Denticeps clupeoides]|uniref:PNPLA domain-containing protein n=1 Tax=Denticeps clupeoides TaxID=299321 RepID=A0AAY4CNA2_9TELE|nr:patatin-like phospholipase domain-containing protein 2 [Denticeps clupeoides]